MKNKKVNNRKLDEICHIYSLGNNDSMRLLFSKNYGKAILLFFITLISFLFLEFNLFLSFIFSLIITIATYKLFLPKPINNKKEYLDILLVNYKAKNQLAYDDLIKKVKENPSDFYIYLGQFLDVERESCVEYEPKKYDFKFTEQNKR